MSRPGSLAREEEAELVAAVSLAARHPWRPRGSGTVCWRFRRLHELHGTLALERALALAGARHEARHDRRPAPAWLLVLAGRLLDQGQA